MERTFSPMIRQFSAIDLFPIVRHWRTVSCLLHEDGCYYSTHGKEMKAFSDIFRSQICVQVGAHRFFPPICICIKDRFGRSRFRSLRHRRAAQGGAGGGKQKSLRAQSCMAGSASADRGSLGVYSVFSAAAGWAQASGRQSGASRPVHG